MNTIKIYLAEDGSIATLSKDFDLYQYEYQNKLLNVYVPLSICAGPFIDNDISTGYSCQLKMTASNSKGVTKITGNFYMRYVKTLTYNSVEYALFERLMPYAFTLYSGTDASAPQLTISVVNIEVTEDAGTTTNTVLSITNSQTCALEVNASTSVQSETVEDASEIDTLEALYSDVVETLAEKQNADTTNDTEVINADGEDHTVAGNINDLLTDVATNTDNIETLQETTSQNSADIENLYNIISYGVNVVGSITLNDLDPTDLEDLAEIVSSIEDYITNTLGKTLSAGMSVFIYMDNTDVDDSVYYFLYDGTDWTYFEMNFLQDAKNGTKGIVAGDYYASGLATADNFMTSIVNGKVVNIYRVDSNGNYTDLKTALDQVIAKLINGTSAVNMAIKDSSGNNIVDTYMTKTAGATKTYVQNYASPKALYDLNYCDFADGEFSDTNVSDTSYDKTVESSAIGYTALATLTKELPADILLGNQNGTTNYIWITSTLTEAVKIRITTAYYDEANSTWVNLSTTETDTISLTAGTFKRIMLESVFDTLSSVITLNSGTTIRQIISVYREVSTIANFTLSCNTTYLSYMEFNKIGYVKYSLESNIESLENGVDAITIDLDSNLNVSGDGTVGYQNGGTETIETKIKIPVDATPTSSSINPITSGGVKTYVDSKFIQGTATIDHNGTWNSTLNDFAEQYNAGYLYYYVISIDGATADMTPNITFAPTEAMSGYFSSICESDSNSIIIFATDTPTNLGYTADFDVAYCLIGG